MKDNLQAVRRGQWKLALAGRKAFFEFARDDVPISMPQLYDLENDVREATDVAGTHPEVVQDLLKLAEAARAEIGDSDRIGSGARSKPE